jgi:hypothetical protein
MPLGSKDTLQRAVFLFERLDRELDGRYSNNLAGPVLNRRAEIDAAFARCHTQCEVGGAISQQGLLEVRPERVVAAQNAVAGGEIAGGLGGALGIHQVTK